MSRINRATVLHAAGPAAQAEQGSVYSAGISAETANAVGLWFGIISLPAGKRTGAHFHAAHETALYMMSGGEVDLYTGAQLEHRDQVRPGDYLFIPAGLPHVAVNRSDVAAVFMGARTDPNANESVVMLPELDQEFARLELARTVSTTGGRQPVLAKASSHAAENQANLEPASSPPQSHRGGTALT